MFYCIEWGWQQSIIYYDPDTTATHIVPQYISYSSKKSHILNPSLQHKASTVEYKHDGYIVLVREAHTSTYTLIRTPLHTICYQGNESPVEEGSEQLLGLWDWRKLMSWWELWVGESLRVGESYEWEKVFESMRVMTRWVLWVAISCDYRCRRYTKNTKYWPIKIEINDFRTARDILALKLPTHTLRFL